MNLGFYASTYVGTHRVLALARLLNNASPAKISVGDSSSSFAAGALGVTVPAASGTRWSVVDCGTITHAPQTLSFRESWELEVTTTGPISLYGFVVLPDNNTCWVRTPGATYEHQQMRFYGASDSIVELVGFNAFVSVESGIARGQLPELPPGVPPTLAFLSVPLLSASPALFTGLVSMLERTRYVF